RDTDSAFWDVQFPGFRQTTLWHHKNAFRLLDQNRCRVLVEMIVVCVGDERHIQVFCQLLRGYGRRLEAVTVFQPQVGGDKYVPRLNQPAAMPCPPQYRSFPMCLDLGYELSILCRTSRGDYQEEKEKGAHAVLLYPSYGLMAMSQGEVGDHTWLLSEPRVSFPMDDPHTKSRNTIYSGIIRYGSIPSMLLWIASGCMPAYSQVFTLDDTLRGSITPERAWWDLTYYHLDIRVFPESKSVSGSVTVQYTVIEPSQVLQIDLQPPLRIDGVSQEGQELSFKKRGNNAYFVTLTKPQQKGRTESVTVRYSGTPLEAENPPWQGGFQWIYDRNGLAFIATSCQGLGASVWWPCKDHMYDEPDSMLMSVTVPEALQDVSNGRLR